VWTTNKQSEITGMLVKEKKERADSVMSGRWIAYHTLSACVQFPAPPKEETSQMC
jgi:hypothetical protein